MSTRIEASCQKIGESGLNNWSSDIGIQKVVHLWASRSRLKESERGVLGVGDLRWKKGQTGKDHEHRDEKTKPGFPAE